MSNRGRHKTNKPNKTVISNICKEINNFINNYDLTIVTVYFSKTGLSNDLLKRFNNNVTNSEIINYINDTFKKGYHFIRVPNSYLIIDKYYKL